MIRREPPADSSVAVAWRDEHRTALSEFGNPAAYYADAAGLFDEPYRLHVRTDLGFDLRPGTGRPVPDREIVREVFLERVYDRHGCAPERGQTVVDVGAHVGLYACRAARRVGDSGSVYALEAHSENFDRLRRHVALNDLGNVHVERAAVGGRAERRDLGVSRTNVGGHSIAHPVPDGRVEPVPGTTLPAILDEHGLDTVDVLKLDVEGAEYEILESTPASYLERVERIVLEEHRFPGGRDEYDPTALRELLRDAGFEVWKENEVAYPSEGRFWMLYARREPSS